MKHINDKGEIEYKCTICYNKFKDPKVLGGHIT